MKPAGNFELANFSKNNFKSEINQEISLNGIRFDAF